MPSAQHWPSLGLCILSVACLLFLCACAGRSPAPIEDRSSPDQQSAPGRDYRVQPGDTLYSVAWRYGLDYRRLAAANNIASPFTIFVGQRLLLREADPASVPSPPPAKPKPRQNTEVATPATPRAPSSVSGSGVARSSPAPAPAPVSRQPVQAATPEGTVGAWLWPADGPVIRRFSSTRHKGIDIGGKEGDPVIAVADGRVVYAGTGIPGYGELLIVRHNARYLSAYGHNDRLLVAEGQAVRAGQTIATRGSSGTDGVKLHFEIRENGRPVDPIGLLPPR